MRIVFAGTPDITLETFEALIENHEVVALYTQPDKKKGRGQKLFPARIKEIALEKSIPVYQPIKFTKDEVKKLADLKCDLMVVFAYGIIVPQAVLETPKFGCVNLHASILPKYRGAAPIHYSLLNNDEETGVTVMQMDSGMDTGDILTISKIPIQSEDSIVELCEKISKTSANTILEFLENFQEREPSKQDNAKATYARKISKDAGKIEFSDTYDVIQGKLRAFKLWPKVVANINGFPVKLIEAKAYSFAHDLKPGTTISISKSVIEIAVTGGKLEIYTLQPENKKPMTISDLINGKHPIVNQV